MKNKPKPFLLLGTLLALLILSLACWIIGTGESTIGNTVSPQNTASSPSKTHANAASSSAATPETGDTVTPNSSASSHSSPTAFTPSPNSKNLVVPGGDPSQVGPWADAPAPGIASEGTPAKATVSVDGRSFHLLPNEGGHFQRVYVSPNAALTVHMEYPEANAGDKFTAQIVDGGTLAGTMAQKLSLSKDKQAEFEVKLTENAGTHRVVLTKGTDVKVLDFWVGAPLAIRTLR